jgi:hypothetical protein
VRVADVLDHLDPVLLRDRHDRVHVARMAAVVDDDDRLRAPRDAALDVGGIDADRIFLDVGEDRRGTQRHAGHRGGPVREARRDQLIAATQADAEERAEQRGGAVRMTQVELRADELAPLGFELLRNVRLRHRAGAQHVDDRLLILFGDDGPLEEVRVERLNRLRPAKDRELR